MVPSEPMVPDPFILKNFYIPERVQTKTKMTCFSFFIPIWLAELFQALIMSEMTGYMHGC